MTHNASRTDPLAGTLVGAALLAPAVLGVFPIRLALIGMGFGPPAWVALSWQLASVVVWAVLVGPVVGQLRRRIDANVAAGTPAVQLPRDAGSIAAPLVAAIVVHAIALSLVSIMFALGRGRPALWLLTVDLLLLYAPMNVMTAIGLIGAAAAGAERRRHLEERGLRHEAEQNLADARTQVVNALEALNGPPPPAQPVVSPEYLERIAVSVGNRVSVLAVNDIDWIEARSYYARLHIGPRHYLVRQSMNVLESRLNPRKFARIHRSTIVNLDRVARLEPADRRSFRITLHDGRQLVMSRRRQRLLDYLGS